MIPGDIVRCKELVKAAGVMGSTLKKYKVFNEVGIVIKIEKNIATVMLSSSSILSVKANFLEVICESR